MRQATLRNLNLPAPPHPIPIATPHEDLNPDPYPAPDRFALGVLRIDHRPVAHVVPATTAAAAVHRVEVKHEVRGVAVGASFHLGREGTVRGQR